MKTTIPLLAGKSSRKLPGQRGRRLMPYIFLLPNMLIFGVFTIYPAIQGFNVAFNSSRNGRTFHWVGVRNYERILSDHEFWQALTNTLLFVVVFVIASTSLSIVVAVLLNTQIKGRGFFRAMIFIPVLLSPVVVGLIWHWMLQRQGGLINEAIKAFGGTDIPWLVDPRLAMMSVIGVTVWTHLGFYTMIILAGLQSIDGDLYQAAALDGTSIIQKFRFITLPLLAPTTIVVVILATIYAFQAFDIIYNFTGGGPVGGTTLMVQFIYEKAFGASPQYGIAAAGSVILFVIILTLTFFNWVLGRRSERA